MSTNEQDSTEPTSSRRTLFKLAGVGLAGVAGAALLESPAEAVTGLNVGTSNSETATTSLQASGSSSNNINALELTGNAGGNGLYATGGANAGAGVLGVGGGNEATGVAGIGSIATATTDAGTGLTGLGGEGGAGPGGYGIDASGGPSSSAGGGGAARFDGGTGATSGGFGALANGGDASAGGNGGGGNGIETTGGQAAGTGYSGSGIQAQGGAGSATVKAGLGIYARGGDSSAGGTGGVGVFAVGGNPQGAPLLLEPNGPAGSPTVGAHTAGEIWMDGTGTMWICTVGGSPGTWTRVLAVPKTSAGATHLLAHPIRLFSATIGAKHNATVHVGGHKVAGLEVPKGAIGVIGTLGVSKTGTHGYLSTFATAPHSSTPMTSSLTWSSKNLSTSAQATIALTAAGTCVIANGFKGASTTAHVTFDAVGYLA